MKDPTAMPELLVCTQCKSPFVAEDTALVARRDGHCLECSRIDVLRRFGLPPDFLTRNLWQY
jgi:hypothetical protein